MENQEFVQLVKSCIQIEPITSKDTEYFDRAIKYFISSSISGFSNALVDILLVGEDKCGQYSFRDSIECLVPNAKSKIFCSNNIGSPFQHLSENAKVHYWTAFKVTRARPIPSSIGAQLLKEYLKKLKEEREGLITQR